MTETKKTRMQIGWKMKNFEKIPVLIYEKNFDQKWNETWVKWIKNENCLKIFKCVHFRVFFNFLFKNNNGWDLEFFFSTKLGKIDCFLCFC